MQPGRDRQLVTAALMLGSFLAAFEATAVAAAVPTAVGEMGGVERYSWVFSAYLLTSTTTVPLFGKLADLYGRRKVYHVSVALFLLGSALSGMAGSLSQLILFRAIQGLGAGGVNPLTITIAGDIYNLKERGRMQGLFSSVWAFSSLSGPLLGGWITDALSWRWIFYLNIPFGIASSLILHRFLREAKPRTKHRLDILGTVSLTTAVTLLLLGLIEGPDVWGWSDVRTIGLFAGSLAALILFLWQEQRAEEPMLPLDLFRNRLISVASAGNLLIGVFLYALTAYVPVFAQGVLGGSAFDAGMALMPVLVGWPIASTLSGRMLMRSGYRVLAIGGGVLLVAGSFLLAHVGPATTRTDIMISMMVIGLGLGFTSMPYLLGPQNAVPWGRRGVVTSGVQFFRAIGGAVGVAALGALFTARLKAVAPGANPNTAFEPALRAHATPETLARLSGALLHSLQGVYFVLAVLGAITCAIAFLFPGGDVTSHVHREGREGLEEEAAAFPVGH
ncbi:MAG TPA: MDR family MFS transporter [Thermoanaerobaculia bacterium]|nr:MDR family MFS transporter [Thermoanaerobaculia bacterium]